MIYFLLLFQQPNFPMVSAFVGLKKTDLSCTIVQIIEKIKAQFPNISTRIGTQECHLIKHTRVGTEMINDGATFGPIYKEEGTLELHIGKTVIEPLFNNISQDALVKEGWVFKVRPYNLISLWKRRYFVLNGATLSYFSEDTNEANSTELERKSVTGMESVEFENIDSDDPDAINSRNPGGIKRVSSKRNIKSNSIKRKNYQKKIKLKGTFNMTHCRVVQGIHLFKSREYCITLTSNDQREVVISTETETEIIDWLGAIVSCIKFALQNLLQKLPDTTRGGVVHKFGWIMKKSKNRFQKRLALLSSTAFVLYADKPGEGLMVKRSFNLFECSVRKLEQPGQPFCLAIAEKFGAEVIVSCESDKEREDWELSIKRPLHHLATSVFKKYNIPNTDRLTTTSKRLALSEDTTDTPENLNASFAISSTTNNLEIQGDKVIKQGQLFMKPNKKNWVNKYVELKSSGISWYKQKEDTLCEGKLSLLDMFVKEWISDEEDKFVFIVGLASNQTKSIMLATNSGDDNREDWILAIRNTMKLIQEDIIHDGIFFTCKLSQFEHPRLKEGNNIMVYINKFELALLRLKNKELLMRLYIQTITNITLEDDTNLKIIFTNPQEITIHLTSKSAPSIYSIVNMCFSLYKTEKQKKKNQTRSEKGKTLFESELVALMEGSAQPEPPPDFTYH